MDKAVFEHYASLEERKRVIEEEQQKMRPQLLDVLLAEAPEGVELSNIGSFVVMRRKTWAYTEAVKKLAEKLKDAQKAQQQTGQATYEQSETLMFTPIKKKVQ